MRLAIGCVQMLLQPGTCTTRVHLLQQVALRPALCAATRISRFGERLLQLLAAGRRTAPGPSGRGPCRCAALAASSTKRAVLRRRAARRRAGRVRLAPLADFFQGGPGERLHAAVEQLPVDLAGRRARATGRPPLRPARLAALRRRRSCARRPATSATASSTPLCSRFASAPGRAPAPIVKRLALARRWATACVDPRHVLQGRVSSPATCRSAAPSSSTSASISACSSTPVGPAQQIAGVAEAAHGLRRRRSASAPAPVRCSNSR